MMGFHRLSIAIGLCLASACFANPESIRRKKQLLCRDIITYISIYPAPADPDVNGIWNLSVFLCLSKVALLARLAEGKEDEKAALEQELKELDPLISATLYALRLSFFVFRPPHNLRFRLIELFNIVKERGESIFTKMN